MNLLYVYNLPTNRDGKSVSNRLRRLSDNCGGKVLSVSAGSAVLRFGSQDAAQRARKRMEDEDVFGNRISVSSRPRAKEGAVAAGSAARAPGPPSSAPVAPAAAEKPRSPRRAGRAARLCQAAERAPSPRKGGPALRSLQVSRPARPRPPRPSPAPNPDSSRLKLSASLTRSPPPREGCLLLCACLLLVSRSSPARL